LTGILARLGHDGLRHLGIGHFNFVLLTQLGQKQAQTHAAFGQCFVLIRRLDLRVVVALNFWVFLMPELMGDLARFCIDQCRRQIELHLFVQRVEQFALHDSPRSAAELSFQTFFDLT